jgi:hypothetical protein
MRACFVLLNAFRHGKSENLAINKYKITSNGPKMIFSDSSIYANRMIHSDQGKD